MTAPVADLDLEQVGALVSLVGLPILLVSVLIAAFQLRAQAAASARTASLQAFLEFSERFMDTSALRRGLESRAELGDVTLTRSEAMTYYNRYWALRQVEYEYFLMGLLPVDVYTAWCENACRHMAGLKSLRYCEQGVWKTLKSDEVFDGYVADGIYRRHPACRDHFLQLRAIVRKSLDAGRSVEDDETFADIRRFVERSARRRAARRAWRLDTRGFAR